jgi:hypothetical protein
MNLLFFRIDFHASSVLLYFILNRKTVINNETKTFAAVNGIKHNCNTKGTSENIPTPVITDSDSIIAGFNEIRKRPSNPRPAMACSMVSTINNNQFITSIY